MFQKTLKRQKLKFHVAYNFLEHYSALKDHNWNSKNIFTGPSEDRNSLNNSGPNLDPPILRQIKFLKLELIFFVLKNCEFSLFQ